MNSRILAVSFGTSYHDSREKAIGGIEAAIGKAFPEWKVERAFTSEKIIRKLEERDHLHIDNVTEALEKMVSSGVKNLIVQPTHFMDGFEYQKVKMVFEKYKNQFEKAILGAPLLTDQCDYQAVMEALRCELGTWDDGRTAFCFMGHGTEAAANGVYQRLKNCMETAGLSQYMIGTVEAEPTLEDVLKKLKENQCYKRVLLQPLMVVAGDHANNDMAGDEEDSWKSRLAREGYEVVCSLKGLGEIPAIQEIYIRHVQTAKDLFDK